MVLTQAAKCRCGTWLVMVASDSLRVGSVEASSALSRAVIWERVGPGDSGWRSEHFFWVSDRDVADRATRIKHIRRTRRSGSKTGCWRSDRTANSTMSVWFVRSMILAGSCSIHGPRCPPSISSASSKSRRGEIVEFTHESRPEAPCFDSVEDSWASERPRREG